MDPALRSKCKATLEANYGIILASGGKARGMVDAGMQLTYRVAAITDIKPACIPVINDVIVEAVQGVSMAGGHAENFAVLLK